MHRFLKMTLIVAVVVAGCTRAKPENEPELQAPPVQGEPAQATKRPPINRLRNAYFGETHLHTTYSLDAYMGMSRNGPDEAYRFAKGEPMPVPGGTARISAPLDFAAVTDHAEFLSDMYIATHPDNPRYGWEAAIKIRNEEQSEQVGEWVFVNVVQKATRSGKPSELSRGALGQTARAGAWKEIQEATERHNNPGVFTTFHAFEWSSAPNGFNLHRNIIFRDAVVPDIPVSALDTNEPEKLWAYLAEYEKAGSTLLAIPHNPNYSGDLMFRPKTLAGGPIGVDWARTRARFEPLVEIMQIKQCSETNPAFAPNDEFAAFESFPIDSKRQEGRSNWVREALKDGLRIEKDLGVNPFKLGFVGATDSHNGTPSDIEENDWVGSHGFADGSPKKRLQEELQGWETIRRLNPGAIAGVWAEENTRAAIFDAMARKETFATSGPRIEVRLFAGWDYPDDLDGRSDMVAAAYAGGVPMGGDLSRAPKDKAPKLLIHAVKGPSGANLDRIQVVKGWLGADGNANEKVFDVAWSSGRSMDADGKLPPVGNTVDVSAATYANTIGNATLSTVWTDPEFDPGQRAFYYARVLEIPTPRWSTKDAASLGVAPPVDVPASIQERAWTSPIWYTP